MQAWQAGWKPAKGDRAQVVNGAGSGTIVDVEGNRIRLKYDLVAQRPPLDLPTGEESGWHTREDLEPIDETASRI